MDQGFHFEHRAFQGGCVGRHFRRRHFSLNVRYQFVLLYTVVMAAVHAAAEDINAAITDGALPVGEAAGLPLHRFDLADTAAAHTAVEESIVGKVLIDVSAG